MMVERGAVGAGVGGQQQGRRRDGDEVHH
jgi:hypothetical protein